MTLSDAQRRYVETGRVGRLSTVDAEGRPHVVPICYAMADDVLYTPLDEKPQSVDATELRRVRNIRANPSVTLVVDHYTEQWDELGWVQLRATAAITDPDEPPHGDAVRALRDKYDQYATHNLEQRPLIRIDVGSVQSWGRLERPAD